MHVDLRVICLLVALLLGGVSSGKSANPHLIVSSGNSSLVEIAPDGQVSTFISGLPGETSGLAFDEECNLYVAINGDTPAVLKIHSQSKAILLSYPFEGFLKGISIMAGEVYVVRDASLFRLDLESGEFLNVETESLVRSESVTLGPDNRTYLDSHGINRIWLLEKSPFPISILKDEIFYDFSDGWHFAFDLKGSLYAGHNYAITKFDAGPDGILDTHDDVRTNLVSVTDRSGFEIVEDQLFFANGNSVLALDLNGHAVKQVAELNDPVYWIVRRPILNTTAGTIQIEKSNYSVNEADGNVVIALIRTGGSQGSVSVNFRTACNSAKGGQDFVGTNTVITFADGETRQEIAIPIINDGRTEVMSINYRMTVEPIEYFSVQISDPTGGATLGLHTTAGVVIYDNDGLPNLLWRHTDGRLAIWEMDRTNRVGKSVLNGGKPVNLEWHLAATADMNGDGHTDFLWQHLDGRVVVWLMQWNEILQKAALNGGRPVADGWRLAAAAHWNRDPHPDLIWRHVDGRVALWRMNGMTRLSSAYLNDSKPVPREWRLVGVNDMYRYPQPQLIWEHQDGRLNVWVMKGVQREHSFSGTGFRPEGPGHISGFGSSWGLWNTPDLCYFQHANGSLTVRGPTMTSPWWTTYLHRSVAPGWKLVGVYPRSE